MIDVIRIQVLSVLSCSRTQEAKVAPKLRDDVGIEALEAGVGEGGGHQHAQPHTAQGGPLTTTSLHTHNNQQPQTELIMVQQPLQSPGPECDDDEEYSDERKEESKSSAQSIHVGSRVFYVGQLLDILDTVNTWSEAEVLKIDRDTCAVYVTYLYWGSSYDEWINVSEDRFASLNTHTYVPGRPLQMGQRVEALDEKRNWLEAFVVALELDGRGVQVHFKGFHKKFDRWIEYTTINASIRPFGRQKDIKKKKLRSCNGELMGAERKPQINFQGQGADKYTRYVIALRDAELRLVSVAGDGNCLFRSVSHQVYGDDTFHALVRQKCMDYMQLESDFFMHFVEGDRPDFDRYVSIKRQNAVWGDDPELQAICELYDRPCEIWAYDSSKGARKLRTFHEAVGRRAGVPPMRLSYYGGGHYDSLCGEDFESTLLRHAPGQLEDAALERCRNRRRVGLAAERAEAAEGSESFERALDMSLESSRREFDNRSDDLDEVLAASMESHLYSSDEKGDDAGNACAAMTDEEFEMMRKRQELIESQGQILTSVAEQSEREYLERALVESMQQSSKVSEEELLKQALEQSLKQEDPDEEIRLAMEMSMVIEEDPALSRALELSRLEDTEHDDHELRAAIQISTFAQLPESAPAADPDYDELQRALEQSLRDI